MDTQKNEARTTKDDIAEDSNGAALVGRGVGRSEGEDPVEEHCSFMSYSG